MAHTFDIRFARSAGLTALFEAPTNRFHWKGAGRLSVDGKGISIAVKRSLANLFSRRLSHRIAAGELTEVYREGEALRLEFGAQDEREVLPIWADGKDSAAEIVKLLPTARTVELEHSTQPSRNYRLDWRVVTWLGFAASLALVASISLRLWTSPAAAKRTAPDPTPTTSLQASDSLANNPIGATIDQILAREGVRSLHAGTPDYDVARRQQALFELELATLRSQYIQLLAHPNLEALEALEPRWWGMTLRIETSEEMSGPAFTGFREAQLAVIGGWRTTLALHAAGLRLKDERLIELAVKQRDLAEVYERLVRLYVP